VLGFLLLTFCALPSFASHDLILQTDTPIIKSGQPFKLTGILSGALRKIEKLVCNFQSDDVIFKDNVTDIPAVPFITLEAITLRCAWNHSRIEATFNCSGPTITGGGKTPAITSIKLPVISGWIFEPKLEIDSSDETLSANFSLTNLETLRNLDVFCNFTFGGQDDKWTLKNETACLSPSRRSDHTFSTIGCKLGEFSGQDSQFLSLTWNIPDKTAAGDLTVKCFTEAGFDDTPCQVAEIKKAWKAVPSASIDIHSGDKAIAGLDYAFNFSVHGIPHAEDCLVSFPASLHPKEAKVPGCTLQDKKYNCTKVEEGKSIVIPLHVNPNEEHVTGSITVACKGVKNALDHKVKIKTQSAFDLAMSTSLKKGVLTLTTTVINKGPSDAPKCVCTVTPSSVPLTSVLVGKDHCNPIPKEPGWKCIMENFTASNDGKKFAVITTNISPDEVTTNGTQYVTVCCETTYCKRANLTLSGGDDTNKPTTQTDGSFWTYAIVVVNLFMIALVVFIGIWWRNRAIAKSLENAPRDREMDLFEAGRGSAGERFIPKAE